jgi:GNAT superfamily N-acetyltransferase
VRRADAADLERVGVLIGEAVEALRGARGGADRLAEIASPLATALEDWASAAQNAVFVGTYADAAVGIAVADVTARGTQDVGRLLLCYVEPEAREVGVGRALLDAVESWAVSAGCCALEAPALPGDRATKRLLEAAGHRARLVVMQRLLSDEVP